MTELLNIDCMEYLKGCKDKEFDLIIADPPYGVGLGTIGTYFNSTNGKRATNGIRNVKKDWDNERPQAKYFEEIMRVSKNQIVWGGNFFADLLPVSRGWICWDKKQPEANSFSDFDLAWTSFDAINRMFRMYPTHVTQGQKIHPSQKPIELYDFILKHYAENGSRILDTHLGSGSSAIACHYFDCDFVGTEIDTDYFNAMMKRYNDKTAQTSLFLKQKN